MTASRNGGKRVWPRAGPVSNSGTLLPQRGRAVTLTLVALLVTALTGAIIMDKAAVGAVPPSSVVNGSGPGPQPMNGMSRPRVVVELVIPASRPLEDPTGWIEPGTMAGAMPLLRRAVVKKGDSLYSLFRRIGLSPEDLMGLLASTSERRDLQRLVPGQVIEYETQPDGSLAIFVLHLDEIRSQRFEREGSRFNVTSVQLPVEPREIFTTGVIRDSLFLDGQRAGLSDKLIMQMAEIFGWDIDFAMDLREGDRFTVIYEALHRDGERIRDGVIVAAEFITQGRVFRAIRFDSRDHYSYYNLEGRSMRKAFLRSPVKVSRITSGFSMRRWHPILHRFRAHRGVDYAGPTGTPIMATGDGRVEYAGWDGGYGKVIRVTHGGNYTTLYAHLSRFAEGIRTGQRVRQGQVIGFLGSTGLATGPHLHYEFRVNGTHTNPLTVRFPSAQPVADRDRKKFQTLAARSAARLDLFSKTALALENP